MLKVISVDQVQMGMFINVALSLLPSVLRVELCEL